MEEAACFAPQKPKGFWLDPRTKVIFMAYVTTLLLFVYEDITMVCVLAAIPFILLMIEKDYRTALVYGGLFVLGIISIHIKNILELPQIINSILVLSIALVVRLFPTFMIGFYIIKSTKVSEFVTAMHRWHISEKLIIPMTVIFRFIPTIREENSFIGDAMRMRDITLGTKKSFKNPTLYLEYKVIPLMISIVKIGEELTAAALTRGLDNTEKRTNITIIGFGKNDFIMLIGSITLLVWAILGR